MVTVHRTVTGPAPPVWVNVAFGVVAFGLNVPVPPPTTLQLPVPLDGVFPPKPVVVPLAQIVCGPPAVAVGDWLMKTITIADDGVHDPLEIVHCTITGPTPPVWIKVAFGVVAFGLNVPLPPPVTLQLPLPTTGVLPPSPRVVPFPQMVCGPPTVAVVGPWVMVIVTSAVEFGVQGEFEIVHRTVTGPVPPVWVKVAFGVVAFGLNVPVPPPTTLQLPVPLDGVFPPKPAVVPLAQIVCDPPTVAVVGGWVMVIVTVADDGVHDPLEIVHCTITGPAPPV